MFPEEAKAIDQYFVDVERADNWYRKHIIYKHLPKALKAFAKPSSKAEKLATTATKDYLDAHIKSQKLKGLLCSQWETTARYPGKAPLRTTLWL